MSLKCSLPHSSVERKLSSANTCSSFGSDKGNAMKTFIKLDFLRVKSCGSFYGVHSLIDNSHNTSTVSVAQFEIHTFCRNFFEAISVRYLFEERKEWEDEIILCDQVIF